MEKTGSSIVSEKKPIVAKLVVVGKLGVGKSGSVQWIIYLLCVSDV